MAMHKPTIREFTDLVIKELMNIPYPPTYEVSNNWKKYLNELVTSAENSTEGEIAQLGISCGYFNNKIDNSIDYYQDIRYTVGDNHIGTVLEVGAGFGSTARLLKNLATRCYIIVDLPEALIFSYAYLVTEFPEANIKIIKNEYEAKTDNSYDFVFCPVQLFRHLQIDNLDLFISTYSLGEVPQKSLDHLIYHIERLRPKFFYSQNIIFTDKTLHYDAGEEQANDIVLKLQPRWFPVLFELESQGVVNKGKMNHRFIGRVGLMRFGNEEELLYLLDRLVKYITNTGKGVEELLKYLYFLALWDDSHVNFFIFALNDLCKQYSPEIDVDKIGEVKYLRGI